MEKTVKLKGGIKLITMTNIEFERLAREIPDDICIRNNFYSAKIKKCTGNKICRRCRKDINKGEMAVHTSNISNVAWYHTDCGIEIMLELIKMYNKQRQLDM